MEQLYQRMLGAAKLDINTFREVEEDTKATGQAAIVIILTAIAAGIGAIGVSGAIGILWGILGGLFGWVVLAGLTYWIGVNLLPKPETNANWGQLARTLAFAQSPGILKVLAIVGVVNGLGWFASLFLFVVSVWALVASVIAVREALDYGEDTIRALIVVILAFIPYFVIFAVLGAIA